MRRLQFSGYGVSFVWPILFSLIVPREKRQVETQSNSIAVVPYFHDVSHWLKSIAANFGVRVVFSNYFRLDRLTPFSREREICTKRHREMFVQCNNGVVYSIPLSCGFQYIGQTKRCLNDRLREHRNNAIRGATNSELVEHLNTCTCSPIWSDTAVLLKERNDHRRLFLEAGLMASVGNAVSRPSVALAQSLRAFVARV